MLQKPPLCTSLVSLTQALFFCTLGAPCPFNGIPRACRFPADRGSSVNVRLLGVGVGVLNTIERRGTRGDEASSWEHEEGEKFCTFQRHQPQPLIHALLLSLICVCLKLNQICSHWPTSFPNKCLPQGNTRHCCHWPIRSTTGQ